MSTYRPAVAGLLSAGQTPMENLTDYFRGPRVELRASDAVSLLLGLGGLILLFWLLSLLLNWQERGCRRPSATRLFLRLSRAHRLAWTDVWLLWRLARSQRLSEPARVFLEPDRFDAVHLSGTLRRSRARLDHLRAKLFADPEPGTSDDAFDATWTIPPEERVGTPLPPITPTPRLPL